jgi:glycosyltransferase involved in cell wall biosynthesis
LVILEAWAAGAPVIASRTSGASALIKPGLNGWLFDLDDPAAFHHHLDQVLGDREGARRQAAEGSRVVVTEYDTGVLARRVKDLYGELKKEKDALRNIAG